MLRTRTRWILALGLLASAGCQHRIPAPYARGQGPTPEQLIGHTDAQLPALQVSKAKVIANRTQRGNLAFIAEAPGRFRGTVEVAGNELVTLAFHEQGYALRYKLDAFPQGFYSGPPSPCAVEALLGISFDTEGLVDLVLGGAPVIAAPYEILDQGWERLGGYEKLTIANAHFVQELRFGWVGNDWRVVGGQLWERNGTQTGRRLWTVEHLELVSEGGAYLPTKTKVSTPGKRRDDTVMINYRERDTDPAFAKNRSSTDGGGSGDSGDPWEDSGDPWEDEGGEDGGWEDGEKPDDDGGWEDGAPSEDGGDGEDPATPEADPGEEPPADAPPADAPSHPDAATEPKAKTEPKPKAKTEPAPIPPEFLLEPTGLTDRGDLCR